MTREPVNKKYQDVQAKHVEEICISHYSMQTRALVREHHPQPKYQRRNQSNDMNVAAN